MRSETNGVALMMTYAVTLHIAASYIKALNQDFNYGYPILMIR